MKIEKRKKLKELYSQYEKDVVEFKKSAMCVKGCADCCIYVGNIDITTFEGIIIHDRLATFEEPLKSEIKARLAQNKMERENGVLSRCAFLQALNLAKQTVKKIQQLDSSGYSGHISYILFLLDKEEFRKRYLRGKFKPQKIADFGQSHGILINSSISR
jgi:hypothetical protein